jgi:hypothetical protein
VSYTANGTCGPGQYAQPRYSDPVSGPSVFCRGRTPNRPNCPDRDNRPRRCARGLSKSGDSGQPGSQWPAPERHEVARGYLVGYRVKPAGQDERRSDPWKKGRQKPDQETRIEWAVLKRLFVKRKICPCKIRAFHYRYDVL